MKRRDFLLSGAATLAAPAILKAQVGSGTPVVGGKRVRRRLSTLADNDPFFEAYSLAVRRMHEQPGDSGLSWTSQARIHADFCEHGTLEFFTWHRPYLDYFERICGALINDPDFALPYWHWGDKNGRIPAPFFSDDHLNVVRLNDSSNYQSVMWGLVDTVPYRYARADFGMKDHQMVAGDFSDQALRNVEEAETFQLLSDLTENPHGLVHVFTGGEPGFGLGTSAGHFSSGLSPLDPIFWLHHSNVDRIWAQSDIDTSDQMATLTDNGIELGESYTGMFTDENEDEVAPIVRDTFNFANTYGYTYDFMVPGPEAERLRLVDEQTLRAQDAVLGIAANRDLALPTQAPSPRSLGEVSVDNPSIVGAINHVEVSVENLADVLTSERVVRRRLSSGQDVFGIAGRRVYARLKGISPGEASIGNRLKVFVDCPYLSSLVPTTDPHFAGSVSFFGCPPDICDSKSFTLDITAPLWSLFSRGRLNPNQVTIQLLPFTGDGSTVGTPVATHDSIDLFYF